MAKVAINGMGRIGRATFKIILDTPGLDLVAVNDLVPAENIAYMLKYDTVYGRYNKKVEPRGNAVSVDGKEIRLLSERDPAKLPWKDMGVDLVFECTGAFTKREDLEKHLKAGAKHVILSAPSKSDDIPTVVHGVNVPEGNPQIISCASCTTNCVTPVVEIIGRRFGIKKAIMTTVHAYTASQSIVDGANKKLTRGRAGAANLVPTSTGAAKAATKALPQYEGKFDGSAVRAPVPAGSISDITFVLDRRTTKDEVNKVFREETASDRYRGILGVSEDPIVSSDIIQDSRASVIDLAVTQVVDGDLLKVMSWYDNEWGYSCQMVREAARMLGVEVAELRQAA
jgi:glyceraldehyde 3-phosphate dehydrogenase (phosphorylating)